MTEIKAVLFDLDNTLIDFMGMKRSATDAAAEAMLSAGLSEDPQSLRERLFRHYVEYGIESNDAFESFLVKEFGVIDYRILAAGVNGYLKEKYLHLQPYPGVRETLNELGERNIKTAVVSDGLRLKAWMRLNAAGLDRFFDIVITFEDTKARKPDPRPFQKAMTLLDVRPEECLFIGDWPERDIDGAMRLGMKTCLARYGLLDKGLAHRADYEIDDIREILKIV